MTYCSQDPSNEFFIKEMVFREAMRAYIYKEASAGEQSSAKSNNLGDTVSKRTPCRNQQSNLYKTPGFTRCNKAPTLIKYVVRVASAHLPTLEFVGTCRQWLGYHTTNV